MAIESAVRSAGTLLSRVRAPPLEPRPDEGSENLRSPSCGLILCKNELIHPVTSTKDGHTISCASARSEYLALLQFPSPSLDTMKTWIR
ncbi:hypothetical protein PoB_007422400 [Plakobranchus ocellatus]|uniref:Uncharacterized protein n=1 Tax=Plakobranchus ocellatus TaxID=259542 RepID=A0AAV4DU81_9GAST|nr:hypothetical protein PoB_007422400 [Plakobranchus ocellatus]